MSVADRMRELLYASERGSASPEVAWLLLGQLALIVGLFCLFWSFRGGDPLIPVWLSWALVVLPVAGLLWHFAVVDILHRIAGTVPMCAEQGPLRGRRAAR